MKDISARVNAVNAFLIAEERGINVTTSYLRAVADLTPAMRTQVITSQGEHRLSGTLFGYGEQAREGRITEINGFHVEAIPHGHMLADA